MKTIKSFFLILNWQTFVVTVLAVASTYFSGLYGFTAEFPLTLIGIAIVFPIVFSINGAYKRREVALDQYGIMKAHGRALYFATRDWMDQTANPQMEEIKGHLKNLMVACRELFHSKETEEKKELVIYHRFSQLSIFINRFGEWGLSSGEVSRANQYLSKMMIAFETIKHIHQYRTPLTLRSYSKVFIYLLPILYGPYFAETGKDYALGLTFLMPILFSVILVSLNNIQTHLENPFDQVGEDDVFINAEKLIDGLEAKTAMNGGIPIKSVPVPQT